MSLKILLFAILIALASVSAALAQDAEPAVSSNLTAVSLPSGALRMPSGQVPPEVGQTLDTIVAHAGDWADTAAERIVALGLPIDARVQTVAAKAKATEVPAGFTRSDELIRDVISDIDGILVDLKTAIDGLGEVDVTSQDVAIEIMRGLDKDRWFLFAHISE